MENIVAKEDMAILFNFFFCQYIFKKVTAAEASESILLGKGLKSNEQIHNRRIKAFYILSDAEATKVLHGI